MPPIFTVPAVPAVTSVPQSNTGLLAQVADPGADTQPTFVGLGAPLTYASPFVDTKALRLKGVVSAADVSSTQGSVEENLGQTPGVTLPAIVPAAPTVIVKQPEPVRLYMVATLYKVYKEYLERICLCSGWTSPTEFARHLLVAMDGAASKAVRGIKAEKDRDLNQIWEALARRFGFAYLPETAMRRFNVREQHEGAYVDLKSPEADENS